MTRIDELLHEYADTVKEMTNDIMLACLQHRHPTAAWEIGAALSRLLTIAREQHPEPDAIAHFLDAHASGKWYVTSIATITDADDNDRPLYIGEDEAGDFISYRRDGRQTFARTFAPPLMNEEDPGAE